MEYEIGDDPQGLPDRPDGDRDGGLREPLVFFRRQAPAEPGDLHDDASDEDSALAQMGEAA
jgi:hypothetical protein